ncbi:RrF2 family transcriptional regulator [Actinokineospora cianjurensis]|uniref:BadM/Rrf2 family transcriptional regulator n=1 Tax=Actinokineospora cianjurensis TaxID=585224 RepID=A0A421B1P4_9PSEU|nr:Rrf2 family transcriptional regulator [Actinokineospora cianjurensis]RLK58277.1 BadM/Rrf2 family transcriptional regulator [Actinokineospora cianjurensis]
MRVSAKADYAIRVLLELAADTSRPITCEAVASTQDIPPRFIKAVIRDLRQAGLVRSQRGCDGGYWLARDAASITVRDAVTAVDGPHLSVRGEPRPAVGYHGTAAHLGGLWSAVESQLDLVLRATTIAHLLAGATPHRIAN